MTLFTYTIDGDYGFAPNPFGGVCTLACCKPDIRRSAAIGDLIIGFGGKKNKLTGKIIYAMIVEEIMSFREYWEDKRFQFKKPNINGNQKFIFGDNIYSLDEKSCKYIQTNSHHSNYNSSTSIHNLKKDTGADRVLVSYDYVYFGGKAVTPPAELSDGLPDVFPHWTRNYYKNYPEDLRPRVEKWLRENFDWGLQGLPERWLAGKEILRQ